MEKLMSIIERLFEFFITFLRETLDLVENDDEAAEA